MVSPREILNAEISTNIIQVGVSDEFGPDIIPIG